MHLTDEQLREMARHAVDADDPEMEKLCAQALAGDQAARVKLEHAAVQPEVPVAPA